MSNMKRFGTGLVTLAIVAVFSMVGIAEETKSKAINDKCPNNGKAINPEKTIDVPVNFCCEKCKAKFDKDPVAFVEKVAKAEEGKCPLSGAKAGDASSTLTIGFCCGNCQGGAKKDPKAAVAKLAKAIAKEKASK